MTEPLPPARRVLIVEDEPDVAAMLGLCVRRLVPNATAEFAGNGALALERLRADPTFDLILCDVMMPGMDGSRLVRHLAEDAKLRHLRVVLLTALDAARVAEARATPNVVEHVQKPVDPVSLAAVLGRVLDG